MKLSIIVPIYNVAPYVRKCVESLLKQDLPTEEYEIILVNDGSTDKSLDVINDFVSKLQNADFKFKILSQQNAGLSVARNAGLKVAKGEYVLFVDSDDYLEPNVLGQLMAQCEWEKLDVLRFDYQNVRLVTGERVNVLSGERTYEVFQPYKLPHEVDMGIEVVDGETYLNTRMGYACYAWQFIIRREIVGEFTTGIHFEDVDWMPSMMLRAKRVNATALVVYNYFWREGSITVTGGNIDKQRKNVEDKIRLLKKLQAMTKGVHDDRWLRGMISSMMVSLVGDLSGGLYAERKQYMDQIKALDIYPLSYYKISPRAKRKVLLINMSLSGIVWILHLLRK